MVSTYTLHFDGSCWPNPGGTAAWGFVLKGEDRKLAAEAGVTGTGPEMSNNVAEFDALAHGLERLLIHLIKIRLEGTPVERGGTLRVYGDSMIVCNIMAGKWRSNAEKLYYPAYRRAQAFIDQIYDTYGMAIVFKWIPRALNQECDDLSKEHNKAPL